MKKSLFQGEGQLRRNLKKCVELKRVSLQKQRYLFGFTGIAGVDSFCLYRTRLITLTACPSQVDFPVNAKREHLGVANEATAKTPALCAVHLNKKQQTLGIVERVGFSSVLAFNWDIR
ncbi:hypothetical protein [Erwinia tasmaniensis]